MSSKKQRSESTSLVVARQIASAVMREVDIDDSPSVQHLIAKGVAEEDARVKIITRTAKRALEEAEGDEEIAKTAMITVNAQGNRLPQCVNLIKKHGPIVAETAYWLHSKLAASSCSIAHMCRILEAMGSAPHEGDDELAFVLDEIAMACRSNKERFFWLNKIPELVEEHTTLESVLNYVLANIQKTSSYFGVIRTDDEEEFWESLSSNDQGA